jgi:hypothetical protein
MPIDGEYRFRIFAKFSLPPPNRWDRVERCNDNVEATKELNPFSVLAMVYVNFERVWAEVSGTLWALFENECVSAGIGMGDSKHLLELTDETGSSMIGWLIAGQLRTIARVRRSTHEEEEQ